MDGFDLRKYEVAKELSKKFGIDLDIIGGCIRLTNKKSKDIYMQFETVKEVVSFLYGYEWAKNVTTSKIV